MKNSIFPLLLLLSCSCRTSTKLNGVRQFEKLNSENFQKLNGVYQFQKRKNENMLHFFKNYDSQTPIEDYQIEVKTHSKKEIGFKLFKEAVCIDSTLIKGKIKRNYFDIKKENSTSSNRFPFWDWHTEKGSIQLIKADTLLINHYKSSANYILFIPVGGGNLWHSYSLKKIK